MAYFLLYRQACLVLEDLPKHPRAKDPLNRRAWTEARRDANTSIAKLELLQPKIKRRYERYESRKQAIRNHDAARRAPRRESKDIGLGDEFSVLRLGPTASTAEDDFRGSSPTRLDALNHQDMAVEQANREIERRTGRMNKGTGVGASPEIAEADRARLIAARRELDEAGRARRQQGALSSHSPTTRYRYPDVDHASSNPPGLSLGTHAGPPSMPSEMRSPAPRRPPKELFHIGTSVLPSADLVYAPPLPGKKPLLQTTPTPPASNHQFISSARLENGASLRTIFLPKRLRHRFVDVAEPNTAAHLETCGILCGTLIRNAFFITKLVIPEQTSTSDTCEMINEEALYTYIDAQPEDLMVLGWIHTHPTQTCFMSSRDLHTHVWYQIQMPESIAIVCSPSKEPSWGVFRLTDPPGIGAIKTCSKPGIFHPHDETHLFTDVLGRPGHVLEHNDLKFEMVDLRP